MKFIFSLLMLLVFAVSCGSEKTCPPPGSGDACTLDGDCREGEVCESGECVIVLKQRGEACQEDAECSSGFCVDSVCCESECAEGCMTCNGPSPGRCEADTAPECSVKYPEDATTIQEAIDSVGDGGVITIGQGTGENIVIETDKAVVIEGDGQNPPEITADDGQTAIHIKDAASVTIRNVQIRGGSFGVQVSAPVPVVLERVHVRDALVGVEVDHGAVWVPEAVALLSACDLFDNTEVGLVVRSAPVDVIAARLHGNRQAVQVENTRAFNLTGTIVSQSFGGFGATFLSSDHILIDGSLFWENNGLGAVVFKNVSDSQVKNSTFNGNGTAGILMFNSASIDIVDATVLDQVNTVNGPVGFTDPGPEVDLGDLEFDGFTGIPKPRFPPGEIDFNFGDDIWQGNGLEIHGSDDVLIYKTFLKGNQGSGILVRDSENIIVMQGHIFLNELSGITADNTVGLWVNRAGVYNNYRTGVQVIGGSSVVDYTSLSNIFPDSAGAYGYGFSADCGQHWLEYNYIYADSLAGVCMIGDAQVHIHDNEIHDSRYAVVMNPGCAPDIGKNEISCTGTDPCLFWGNMDPAPAPAPDLPADVPGE